jgi:hypothetical protein
MFSYGQFHDGAFDGLLIHDKTVYVFVSTDQKEHFVLIATGVVAMIANGMQAGNIILDVERWTAEELTLRDIRDVYGYQPSPDDDGPANHALARAQKTGLSILTISPSYGGSCLLLAEAVGLATRREWFEGYLKTWEDRRAEA